MEPSWVSVPCSKVRKVKFDASKGMLDVHFSDEKVFRFYNMTISKVYTFLKKTANRDAPIDYLNQVVSNKKTQRIG
jgi:hypothetical protein